MLELLFIILCAFINCQEQFELFARSSLRVYPYRNYGSTTISNYKITPEIGYASFRFSSHISEGDCSQEMIHVYIRFGSLPIIDPKNVSFPDGFVINNQNLYHKSNLSTKFKHCIDIASPFNGYYFVVAFLHPKFRGSQSLWHFASNVCKINLTTSVYVQRQNLPFHIQFSTKYQVFLNSNLRKPVVRFQFIKPKKVRHAELTLRNIHFLENSSSFVVQLTRSGVLHSSLILFEGEVTKTRQKKIALSCELEERISYGINFFSKNFVSVQFNFKIENSNRPQNSSEVVTHVYQTYKVRKLNPFRFFFRLVHSNSNVINLNMNEAVTVLFVLNDGFDVGGTLSFRVRAELSENQQVIVCINNTWEIPMKPNLCVCNKQKSRSPLVLNAAVKEAVVHVPYPLSGIWYASFTMTCFDNNSCSNYCQDLYSGCTKNCTRDKCANRFVCDLCKETCAFDIERFKCTSENCRNFLECPESIVRFTLASYSCFEGTCDNGGKCVEKISQGCAYSVCTCYNKFRGWTCSDGSNIVSPQMIHLELFFVLSSLLIFLVAGYFAFKRKCYEESTVYVAKFFSSSLSHSCQSGKYLYNLCIFDREKLFLTDIYCGFLTIWLTIGAVACFRKPLRNVFQMIGAVVVFLSVTLDVQLFYVGVISFEILVGIINWSYLNVLLHLRLPSNLYTYVYLPSGIVLFCSAMVIYVLLQNESNFIYLHPLWHILLGLSYIFLIPDEKYTFPTVQSYFLSSSRLYEQSQISDVSAP